MRNNATDSERAEWFKKLAEGYPDICARVKALADEAISIVQRVHPIDLLRRGYFDCLMTSLNSGPEESKSGFDSVIARDMIGYVQKLVCAVGDAEQERLATDDEYHQLRECVTGLYQTLMGEYFIARTAHLRQRPDYDRELDEFAFRAEGHWMYVEGSRYAVFDPVHLRALLEEHEQLLMKHFSIGIADVERGVKSIQRSLTFGVQDSMEIIAAAQEQLPHPDEIPSDTTPEQILEDHGLSGPDSPLSRAVDCLYGFQLFDVERVTGWPAEFCQALSVKVGTDSGFTRHADRGGWPTQPSECDVFPFVLCNGKSYVFNQARCMDTLYRSIERAVLSAEPKQKETWNLRQKRTSERLALDIITKALPGAAVFPSVHYPITQDSDDEQTAECDGIVLVDGHLLVVEVKAGAFSHKSPAIHPKAHIDALKALVREPINQGRRFVELLESQGSLELLDQNESPICTLTNSFDSISVVCITLDPISDMTPQIEHLRLVGVESDKHPVWPLSIDDLRVVADVLPDPISFMHFIRMRLQAFTSRAVHVNDELDHLGLYLKENDYAAYAEGFTEGRVQGWHGYRDQIDRYYHQLLVNEEATRPRQNAPRVMLEIIDILNRQQRPGYIWAGCRLLDMDEDLRLQFGERVSEATANQVAREWPCPVSIQGSTPITIFVNTRGGVAAKKTDARVHACADLQIGNDHDRLLLILELGETGELLDVEFERLTREDALSIDENILRPIRIGLAQSRKRCANRGRM